jgi:hypothetical protein
MKRDRGNREWLNDYMSLKQVNPENPFTAPEGYFDSLDGQILSKIRLEELKENMPEPGFAVPENYFDELTNKITSRINVEKELDKEAAGFTVPEAYFDELTNNITARVAIEEALDKEAHGFVVPENYFDELTNNITARVNIEEALNKETTGFAVPDGYFHNLDGQIQSRIFFEETLSKPEGFTVPENYFNTLSENILSKTASQEKEKSRGAIIRRMVSSGVFKYAAAACFVLGISGTIFLNRATNPEDAHNNSLLHKSLAAIPIDDIQNYLQLHLDANDSKMLIDETKPADADNLSKDLQEALDTTSQ